MSDFSPALYIENYVFFQHEKRCSGSIVRFSLTILVICYHAGYLFYRKWASTRENLSSEVCEQHKRRPACADAQSDQRIC